MENNATRGKGMLEGFLAKQRTKMAESLIPVDARKGSILDIGCGNYPYFLSSIEFGEKHGIDRLSTAYSPSTCPDINLKHFDMETDKFLPYRDEYFDVVTMLAVLEHLEPETAIGIARESYRVTKKGGSFIATTPAWWTDSLLKLLARLNIVSKEEIDEHKNLFSRNKLSSTLAEAGFDKASTRTGIFEFGMNLWVVARK